MEFTGTIIDVLGIRSGISKNNEAWVSQEYVIEDASDKFPKKMVFEVFGTDKIKQFNIQKGDAMKVTFDIDARQWNDRWFNTIRAWKVEKIESNNKKDDMPF